MNEKIKAINFVMQNILWWLVCLVQIDIFRISFIRTVQVFVDGCSFCDTPSLQSLTQNWLYCLIKKPFFKEKLIFYYMICFWLVQIKRSYKLDQYYDYLHNIVSQAI